MVKEIKFNLIINGKSCRTIKDLKTNFNIDDVLKLYEDGRLLRWLEVRKYDDYAKKLQQMDNNAYLDQKIKDISSIFGFSSDMVKKYTAQKYTALKETMKINSNNMEILKKSVTLIEEKYIEQFAEDYKNFFHEINNTYPLIVYRLLMHQKTREYLLYKNKSISTVIKKNYCDILSAMKFMPDIEDKYSDLPLLLKPIQILSVSVFQLPIRWPYFKIFHGNSTNGKSMTVSTKKVMILYIEGCSISEVCALRHQVYNTDHINGSFRIFNGIAYTSQSANAKIIYMEI